jgi:hypothetical protein
VRNHSNFLSFYRRRVKYSELNDSKHSKNSDWYTNFFGNVNFEVSVTTNENNETRKLLLCNLELICVLAGFL